MITETITNCCKPLYRQIIVVFGVVLLSACLPTSEHPISPPDPSLAGEHLAGTWFRQEQNARTYIHAGRARSDGTIDIAKVDLGEVGTVDVAEFSGHISRIKKNHFLNLKRKDQKQALSNYLILKYSLQGDNELRIWFMDNEALAEAVAEKKIKGVIQQKNWINNVTLTDNSKRIRKYIKKYEKTIFKESVLFQRHNPRR